MIGVNFFVVISRLPYVRCRAALPSAILRGIGVGGQRVVFEQRRLLGQHRAVDEQADHLPRRGLRRGQPQLLAVSSSGSP